MADNRNSRARPLSIRLSSDVLASLTEPNLSNLSHSTNSTNLQTINVMSVVCEEDLTANTQPISPPSFIPAPKPSKSRVNLVLTGRSHNENLEINAPSGVARSRTTPNISQNELNSSRVSPGESGSRRVTALPSDLKAEIENVRGSVKRAKINQKKTIGQRILGRFLEVHSRNIEVMGQSTDEEKDGKDEEKDEKDEDKPSEIAIQHADVYEKIIREGIKVTIMQHQHEKTIEHVSRGWLSKSDDEKESNLVVRKVSMGSLSDNERPSLNTRGNRTSMSWQATEPLQPEDFVHKERIILRPLDVTKARIQFQQIAWKPFRRIRALYNLSDNYYLQSLAGDIPLVGLPGAGKSGSFFFWSQDSKFIIKTLSPSEYKFLIHILPDYVQYLTDFRDTTLTKFFGLYKFKFRGKSIIIVCMNNVFNEPSVHMNLTFDLKGSTRGRAATEEEKKRDDVILKDLDFGDRKIHLGAQMAMVLFMQLEQDCRFLQRFKIMDYSFLLGIHELSHSSREIFASEETQALHVADLLPIQRENSASDELDHLKSNEDVNPSITHNTSLDSLQADSFRSLPSLSISSTSTVIQETRGPSEHVISRLNRQKRHTQKNPTYKSVFQKTRGGTRGMRDDGSSLDEPYNVKKQAESSIKSILYDRQGISAIESGEYAKRFLNYLRSILD